jgi:agmatine/peptidylarginine deiminase
MRQSMTSRWLIVLLVLLVAAPLAAQQAKRVPRDFLATIVDDEPNPLPRSMTEAERAMPLPLAPPPELLAPPAGFVYTPAEYDHNNGLLISWGSFNSVLTEMTVGVTTGDPDGIVYVIVPNASQQASAISTLTAAGADMSQVEFILYNTNSVWIRDYGPRFIEEDGQRAIVDHTYNRPTRPNDNALPDFLSTYWGLPQYDIPLVHGGGNFHLWADRDAYMTELILNENPGLSEAQVIQLYLDYQNLALTITDPLPANFDSTQHIDMWMLTVSDREVIIGEYDSSSVAYPITETWATELASRGYTVHRTPGWISFYPGGTHYTYTNAVVFNDLVFIPEFSGYPTENAQAVAVFEAAFPGKQVIPVDCSDIIAFAGAIHCVVMHVPELSSEIFADGFESGDTTAWSVTVE